VNVVAISADDRDGALKMVERKRLTFTVLSDPNGGMLRAYRHWDDDSDLGLAGTFVVRPDRTIVFYEDDGERFYRRPSAARLLEAVRAL
jgi:peroxiredoxin